MQPVRIVQLTDLHSNGTDEWEEESFSKILSCLINLTPTPNLLVLTGDLVEKPDDKSYKLLNSCLTRLRSELQKVGNQDEPFVLAVPGNHDYYELPEHKQKILSRWLSVFVWCSRAFKNTPSISMPSNINDVAGLDLGPLTKRSQLFDKWIKEIAHPGNSSDDVAMDFMRRHKILVYPFDSNSATDLPGFAQGLIKDPEEKIRNLTEKFKRLCDNKENFDKYPKLALLHHHPLPVATSKDSEYLEGFMVLRNANHFLRHISKEGINLILHGHEHVSGISEYKLLDDPECTSVNVLSCASTGKLDEDYNELVVIDVTDRGSISSQSWRMKRTDDSFIKHNDIKILQYGVVRKVLNMQVSWQLPIDSMCGIKTIASKTRLLEIDINGNACVTHIRSNISWRNDIPHEQRTIKERVRADLGRAVRGTISFSDHAHNESSNDREIFSWERKTLGVPAAFNPYDPEDYKLKFNIADYHGAIAPKCCVFRYSVLNVFAMTKEQHAEMYKKRTGKNSDVCWEASSIETSNTTELLELIVRFPGAEYFPKGKIEAVAYRKDESTDGQTDFVIDENKELVDIEETNFLHNKNALRLRPEFNEIELVVRHPLPDLVYKIRWAVPTETISAETELSLDEIRMCEKIRAQFADPKSSNLQNFYKDIVGDIWPDECFKVVIFGCDKENALLKVTAAPDGIQLNSCNPLAVGRGPAGVCFKRRGVVVYPAATKSLQTEDSKAIHYCENVIPGLVPTNVLCLPLMYPRLMMNDWPYKSRCPVFGVISIVMTDPAIIRPIEFMDPAEIQESDRAAANQKKLDSLALTFKCLRSTLRKTIEGIPL